MYAIGVSRVEMGASRVESEMYAMGVSRVEGEEVVGMCLGDQWVGLDCDAYLSFSFSPFSSPFSPYFYVFSTSGSFTNLELSIL